jgi:predicted RNA binding protein YcfA (HicA-like mRNA interferase family)
MKACLHQLERQDFSASKTRGGHWRLEHPHLNGPVFAPDTPSDHRSLKNLYQSSETMTLGGLRDAAGF